MTVDELLEEIIELGDSMELYRKVMLDAKEGKSLAELHGEIESYCINKLQPENRSLAYMAGYINSYKNFISYINRVRLRDKKFVKWGSYDIAFAYLYSMFLTACEYENMIEDYMYYTEFKEGFRRAIIDFVEGIPVKD